MKMTDQIGAVLLKFLSMLFLIILPVRSVMIAVGCLVFCDLISGLWAAKKNKIPITSSGLRRTVIKLLAYEFVILFGFIMEQYLVSGIPIVKIVGGMIAVSESKSFFENMDRITGVNFLAELLKKLQSNSAKSIQPDSDDDKK